MISRDTLRLTSGLIFVFPQHPQKETGGREGKREGENSESGLVLRGPNPWNLSHPVTDVQQLMSWPHVSQLEGYWPEEGYKETGPILHGKGDPAALSWLKEAACSWEDGEGFVLKRCGGWPREWVWQMFFVILQHMGLPFPPSSLGKILWHRHTWTNGPCLTSVWLQMGAWSFVDLRSLNNIKMTALAAHAGRRGAGHSWSAK